MLIKKHRTLFGIFVSFILIFLVCSIVSFRSDSTSTQSLNMSAEKLITNDHYGYEIRTDENGKIFFKSVGHDSWHAIGFQGERFQADWLFITFNAPVNRDLDIVLYYSKDGEAFNSQEVYAHKDMISSNGLLSIVSIEGLDCLSLRLDIKSSEEFSIKEVSFYDIQSLSAPQYKLNVAVLIIFILLLALLIVFEKKIGYFDWIYKLALADIDYFKELYRDKRFPSLVLHGLMRLTNLVFLFSVFSMFWTSGASTQKIIWMFTISCITLGINIAEKIVTGSFATPERMFLIVALIIGVMLSLCLPLTTLNVPDEEIHYENCLKLETALFGGKMSFTDMRMIWRHLSNGEFINDPTGFAQSIATTDALSFSYDNGGFNNLYNMIGYLPVAIVMAIGDLLKLSYVQTFMFSKLVCIIVYSFVVALGIKKLKSGGYLVSAICLMPSMLILASSLTYDSWVMAFVTFGISYFISELQQSEKKLTVIDCAIMLGAMLLGCGPKAVYFVLMLPMLFMPKSKFKDKKAQRYYLIACALTMLIILLSFALPFLINTGGASDYRGGSGVNSSEQLKFILKNPFAYLKIVFEFISYFLSFENMSNNITSHTYLGTPYTFYATVLIFILMFVAFTDKSENDMFKNRHVVRGIGALACVGATMLVVTALYIAFTPVAHPTINGVQYRYVFPIMPLFFYCISPARVHSHIDRRVTQTMVYGGFALMTVLTLMDVYIPLLVATLK